MTDRSLRIAWLLPVAWFYWQPSISEFSRYFPNTKVFTALWPGFAKGFEDSLDIEIVGNWKVVKISDHQTGYGKGLTYVSPAVIMPLLQFKPDVIFTNSFGIWTLLALLFKPLGGWKVIIAYEGSSPGVDFLHSPLRLWIRKRMVQLADAFITNSQIGKKYLTEVLNAHCDSTFSHPYEVPAAQSLLVESEISQSPPLKYPYPVFLFVGRIIPRKGLQSLLDACSLLSAKGCTDYMLLIIGDGDQRAELEKFSQHNQLTHNVKWLGQVDYNQISTYFQSADVFILPTHEDTWGVVVLEALLFGKPVLCSTGAGSQELIIDGKNGYKFSPGDSKYLASLMEKCINENDLVQNMSMNSKRIMGSYAPKNASDFLLGVVEYLS
jgi:glycosyltransferase involved in cell wall biosynthesis